MRCGEAQPHLELRDAARVVEVRIAQGPRAHNVAENNFFASLAKQRGGGKRSGQPRATPAPLGSQVPRLVQPSPPMHLLFRTCAAIRPMFER